jgi:hypothetical protein
MVGRDKMAKMIQPIIWLDSCRTIARRATRKVGRHLTQYSWISNSPIISNDIKMSYPNLKLNHHCPHCTWIQFPGNCSSRWVLFCSVLNEGHDRVFLNSREYSQLFTRGQFWQNCWLLTFSSSYRFSSITAIQIEQKVTFLFHEKRRIKMNEKSAVWFLCWHSTIGSWEFKSLSLDNRVDFTPNLKQFQYI